MDNLKTIAWHTLVCVLLAVVMLTIFSETGNFALNYTIGFGCLWLIGYLTKRIDCLKVD